MEDQGYRGSLSFLCYLFSRSFLYLPDLLDGLGDRMAEHVYTDY